MMIPMTKCSTPGCDGLAECNPADTENGPNVHDLDPVYCDACYQAWQQDQYDTIAALEALGFGYEYIYFTPGTWPANCYPDERG